MKTRLLFCRLLPALLFCWVACQKSESPAIQPVAMLWPEDILLAAANSLKDALRFDSATTLYRQAESLFLEKNNWEKVIICRRSAAWCRWYDHDSEAAMNICTATLPFATEKLGAHHLEIARLYIILGNIHADRRTGGSMRHAVAWFEQARRIFRQHYGEQDPALAEIYERFAIAYFLADDYTRGIQYADSAMVILEAPSPANAVIWCRLYNNTGLNYEGLGRFDRALECFQKARQIALAVYHVEDSKVVKYLKNIAHAQLGLGDAYAAQLTYEEALALVTRVEEPGGKLLAFVREGLGDCRMAQGDTATAILIYRRCLDEFWPAHISDNRHGRALLLYKIGQCQLALGQANAAATSFQASSALADARQMEAGNFNRAKPLLGRGDALAQSGNGRGAENCWRRAQAIALPVIGPRHPLIATIQTRMARHYLQTGRCNEALAWTERAQNACLLPSATSTQTPAFTALGQPAAYLAVLHLRGQIHAERYRQAPGNYQEIDAALRCDRQALAYADTLRTILCTDEARLDLQEQVAAIAENALDGLYQKWLLTGQEQLLDTAFFFMEKSKSALLAAGLRESAAREAAHLPADLLEKELALKTQCHQLHHFLATAGPHPADPERVAQVQQEWNHARHALETLLALLRRDYPAYFKWKYEGPVATLAEVKALAKARTSTLVEYFWGDRTLYAFAISPGQVKWLRLGEPAPTTTSLQALRSCLTNYDRAPSHDAAAAAGFQQFCQHAGTLYERLLQPLLLSGDTTPIIIVPDGLLGYLPFHILLTRSPDVADLRALNYRRLPYLLRQRPVQYEFSATALTAASESAGLVGPYVGFAPDYDEESTDLYAASAVRGDSLRRRPLLPRWSRGGFAALRFNRPEVNACAALTGGQALLGPGATRQNFQRLAPQAGILHLAMHASTDDSDPSLSALVFSDAGESNRLFAYELSQMRLTARLAILSACNTGVGRVQKGEGVMSLARAFRQAGCPAMVMGLWPVDDAAAGEVVGRFFTNLQQGQDKSRALRGAALSYLSATKSDRSAHPGYWASLVLVGDGQPLPPQAPMVHLLAAVLGLVGLSLGLASWATQRFWKPYYSSLFNKAAASCRKGLSE